MHILQINYSTYLYDNHFSNSLSSNLKFVFFFLKFWYHYLPIKFYSKLKAHPFLLFYYTLIISKLFKWSMTWIVV